MLRVIRVLGLLGLIFAAFVLLRMTDEAPAVSPSNRTDAVGSKPIGTSTLTHSHLAPHPGQGQASAHPDRR